MKIHFALLLLLLLFAAPAFADGLKLPASALIVAQSADIWSTHVALGSGQGYEANGLMAGSETRRIALKALTTTGALYLLSKVEPSHPRLTKIVTYGLAGAMGAVAVHNFTVGRQ